MNKSDLRQKILKKRKKFHLKNLSINPKELLKILNNKKFINKVIGGYYPYNSEVNVLKILKVLEKKKYKISLPKILKKKSNEFL